MAEYEGNRGPGGAEGPAGSTFKSGIGVLDGWYDPSGNLVQKWREPDGAKKKKSSGREWKREEKPTADYGLQTNADVFVDRWLPPEAAAIALKNGSLTPQQVQQLLIPGVTNLPKALTDAGITPVAPHPAQRLPTAPAGNQQGDRPSWMDDRRVILTDYDDGLTRVESLYRDPNQRPYDDWEFVSGGGFADAWYPRGLQRQDRNGNVVWVMPTWRPPAPPAPPASAPPTPTVPASIAAMLPAAPNTVPPAPTTAPEAVPQVAVAAAPMSYGSIPGAGQSPLVASAPVSPAPSAPPAPAPAPLFNYPLTPDMARVMAPGRVPGAYPSVGTTSVPSPTAAAGQGATPAQPRQRPPGAPNHGQFMSYLVHARNMARKSARQNPWAQPFTNRPGGKPFSMPPLAKIGQRRQRTSVPASTFDQAVGS